MGSPKSLAWSLNVFFKQKNSALLARFLGTEVPRNEACCGGQACGRGRPPQKRVLPVKKK